MNDHCNPLFASSTHNTF